MTDDVRKRVREEYAAHARRGGTCCAKPCGCGSMTRTSSSGTHGYTREQLDSIPNGADLGLGCGNPTALASLRQGETVLDLGSGAGIDCFLAVRAVGETGSVIGVDMTPAMLDRARDNVRSSGAENVEFRLGEIENLPVADGTVDVAISNCVINLSPDKPRVFREVHRALKPGGRMVVSDIVLLKELPAAIRDSIEAYAGCVAGASKKEDYLAAIQDAGFEDIRVVKEVSAGSALVGTGDPKLVINGRIVNLAELGVSHEELADLAFAVQSITLEARKPE
jgi:arsenite methyltransferase